MSKKDRSARMQILKLQTTYPAAIATCKTFTTQQQLHSTGTRNIKQHRCIRTHLQASHACISSCSLSAALLSSAAHSIQRSSCLSACCLRALSLCCCPVPGSSCCCRICQGMLQLSSQPVPFASEFIHKPLQLCYC